ncbi:MJ0042-type zinc finger domain-containing protein [Blastopirellula retiformator]|uniref:Zinc finger/thioredoxin putative domain-containing protein n=1 Tax=Blastopirellula retiformator TaxID=2527970 RepID=A0A5C5VJ48_9BACT|nr:MJ0042-type zinc finger domain-containing protein [Blastopirellula retiformator]TWT38674.1 hypothetical protein Enr8_03670 [Blastopirellula retiformator]
MSFIAACPHCQAKFAAQDHLAGKNVRCPKCKEPFRIGDVVSQAEKKAKAARQQRRVSDSSQEDLPVAKAAAPKQKSPSKPKRQAPPPSATPTRSWKEIAGETPTPVPESPAPQSPPAPTKPAEKPAAKPAAAKAPDAKPAAPASSAPRPQAQPAHATPSPDQPIVLNPAQLAAWEALPPIILATARHEAVELAAVAASPAPPAAPNPYEAMDDDDLDDSCLDGPYETAPAFTATSQPTARPAAAPPAPVRPTPPPPAPEPPPQPEEEVIELGFDDLVIERMEDAEAVEELSDDDFLDDAPVGNAPSGVVDVAEEVITEVEIIEETPRRSSGSLAADPGPRPVKPQPSAEVATIEPTTSDKRQTMMLIGAAGGGLALVLLLIGLTVAMSGGSNKFQPSESFRPTTSAVQFFDPSGKIVVRFPQPYAQLPPVQRGDVSVRGANLVGKAETFEIFYSNRTPVASPPSGAKPIREHWLAFDLPELADASPYIASIRRHKIGGNYAVEYQLATDIVRDQPGETRVLLIFIRQRMFVVLWAGDHYHDEVDQFFESFSIDGDKFVGS